MERILVVDADGDRRLAAALARATSGGPFTVDVAAGEAEALLAMQKHIDMIFIRTMDQRSARLIRRLRARHPSAPVAVIAPEASGSQEVLLRREGILCYLQEPVSDQVLRQVVYGATLPYGASWFSGGTGEARRETLRDIAAKDTGV